MKVAATKTWHVEGEWLTTAKLAERLGTSHYAAYKRMRGLTKLNMPITWPACGWKEKVTSTNWHATSSRCAWSPPAGRNPSTKGRLGHRATGQDGGRHGIQRLPRGCRDEPSLYADRDMKYRG